MPASAVVLLLGAAVYAFIQGPLGVTFDATPLLLGAVVATAAVAGRATRLAATALVLAGWGAAVLLVRHGPLPDDREAAAFLVGVGLGLVAARLLGRAGPRELGDGSATVLAGGLAFYLAYDLTVLNEWPLWCAALVVWAGWEAIRARRGPNRGLASRAGAPLDGTAARGSPTDP